MTQKPWLATILTTETELPARQAVQAAMNRIPGYEKIDFEWVSEKPNHYVFRTKYAMLAVTLTDAQEDPELNAVPESALRSACARAWHWVEAAVEVPKATRQLLVAVLPEEDELEPLDSALLLTCLAVAVLENVSATAIFWNHSGMLHEPKSFIEHAQGMNRRTIPVELWVEFRLVLNSDLTVSIGTWGLKAFALNEMEVSHSRRDPQWILRWLFNLAHFMFENGPIDAEMEHTFGRSDKDTFTLSYGNTAPEIARNVLEEVVRVQFDAEK